MKYRSTQGFISNITFEETLLTGWRDDGSLLVPEYIPELSEEELVWLSSLSYKDIVTELFKLFVGEDFISHDELKGNYLTGGPKSLQEFVMWFTRKHS